MPNTRPLASDERARPKTCSTRSISPSDCLEGNTTDRGAMPARKHPKMIRMLILQHLGLTVAEQDASISSNIQCDATQKVYYD